MGILIKNIKKLLLTYTHNNINTLAGQAMQELPSMDNAYLYAEHDCITAFGSMDKIPDVNNNTSIIDAQQGIVLPTWVDSHTHLVHATTREEEFVQRIQGKTYEEIAAAGGGILNSANKLANTSEQDLLNSAKQRLHQAILLGTGAIEIKSGYGLSVQTELKMLRVIKQLKAISPIPIKATFLGAHAYPLAYKQNHQGYINLIINEMLPAIAAENLADYIDVFCEQGFFSVEETTQILQAGIKHGLKPKIHANQLYNSGGVQVGVANNAISVDHLECIDKPEVNCLLNSNTLPVLLPGAAFFLGMHYQPARMLIDAGLPVVLASDYNPGSCPSFNMNFITSLACTQMKLTPNEAIAASTINGAAALELQHSLGTIAVGKKANLILTQNINSHAVIPYWFGMPVIQSVFINGSIYNGLY
jgi:imidazolonepropionase